MKKLLKVCLCGLTAAAVLTGCAKAADGTVKLGNYKGIEVTKEAVEVTDEEVESTVQSRLQSATEYIEVDHSVEEGNIVNIDYVGTKDGVAFEGGTAEGYDLTIGSGQFIDGFEEGLVGAKKGEKVSLNLTFPEQYQSEELAGQAVVFDVTVNTVKEMQVPEFNDAFVTENSDFSTVEEYREDIKQTLLSQKEAAALQKVESDVLQAVFDSSTIKPNPTVVTTEYENYLMNVTNQAAAYGLDLATFASFNGMTETAFKQQLQESATNSVKQRIVCTAIAKKEKLTITDEDKQAFATEMGYESLDQLMENADKTAVDNYLIIMKTMEFLVDNAVIN
jgi:trigger factor